MNYIMAVARAFLFVGAIVGLIILFSLFMSGQLRADIDWPTKSNKSETKAYYGYVYEPYTGIDIVRSVQDFNDFMRDRCAHTNSFWLKEAEKAKRGADREEALGYLQDCHKLYPAAWE